MNALESSSTRPYLLRALYEWCSDNGFTPYVAVAVDDTVQVPREYVKDGEIVLNISYDATSGLQIGNEFIEFKARFAGIPRDIMVPIGRVMAIYARENGQGMAFPLLEPPPATMIAPAASAVEDAESRIVQLVASEDPPREDGEALPGDPAGTEPEPPRPSGGGRPSLKRVKEGTPSGAAMRADLSRPVWARVFRGLLEAALSPVPLSLASPSRAAAVHWRFYQAKRNLAHRTPAFNFSQ